MKVRIFAFSRQGCRTAERTASLFKKDDTTLYTVERLLCSGFDLMTKPYPEFFEKVFNDSDILVFIGSCGIAVRKIAPFVRSKKTDPAVVVIDELAHFSISLLSGHIGGANRLALDLAEHLGAEPVITTATDINHRFSADAWAARYGYAISDMNAAKAVSAAILEGDVPFCADLPSEDLRLPAGLVYGHEGETGIYFGYKKEKPFGKTMRIIPAMVRLGIGCRKGISKEAVAEAVKTVLADNNVDKRSVLGVYSIDLKAEEPGLLEFCSESGWELHCYSADELNALEGDFSASSFVRSITGADNVCERSALMEADKLIIKKTAVNGVTVAAAIKYPEVSFE